MKIIEMKIGRTIYFLAIYGLLYIPELNALDVYIIGGRGDLARRYLWKGFFDLFRKYEDEEMYFYGTGRTKLATEFSPILLEAINCSDDDCENARMNFISKAKYLALQDAENFGDMCSKMRSAKGEVIIYFSVPPTAYEKVMKMIVSHCGSDITQKNYKFVFEKPFGEDLESAISLSKMLKSYAEESQVYRVDHYLGKETVHQILDFREKNPTVESMMDRHSVEGIEIVVAERVGCLGRASYYDKSGAIRDMLQSHLTEILCLLTMNIDGPESKLQLLRNVSTVKAKKDLVLAQYKGYTDEVALETGRNSSSVPTFASARMYISGSRWKGVPVVLSSGKMLNERNGYARVKFRGEVIGRKSVVNGCEDSEPQLLFVIRHEKMASPAILLDRKLPISPDYAPAGWMETSVFNDVTLFGIQGKCFRIFVPAMEQDAYSYLIERLFIGDRGSFPQISTLLESWRIWSPSIKEVDQNMDIRLYDQGSNLSEVTTPAFASRMREEL